MQIFARLGAELVVRLLFGLLPVAVAVDDWEPGSICLTLGSKRSENQPAASISRA